MKRKFITITYIILFLSACNFPSSFDNININEVNNNQSENNKLSEIQSKYTPAATRGELTHTWISPPLGASWQWQLSETLTDIEHDILVYDVDYEEISREDVSKLKSEGHYAICYISVGSWEEWRGDADNFPKSVLGYDYESWSGERWLDIRQISLLAPILEARMDICMNKGFDGIEPDNMDGYTNVTGFPLTYDDQLKFNLWLADEAHQRGLSIGMKNNEEQTYDLVNICDWAMTEDCFVGDWCDELSPFIQAGKPVFAAEYTDTEIDFADFCQRANELGLSPILKDRNLTSWVEFFP